MDEITVKVKDLFDAVCLIKKDGAKTVTLYISEPDYEFDIPATLEFSAVGKFGEGVSVDYEGIEAVPDDSGATVFASSSIL